MPSEPPGDGYPASMRAVALIGLFLAGAVAFILLDIAANGKLTDRGGCGCDDSEPGGGTGG